MANALTNGGFETGDFTGWTLISGVAPEIRDTDAYSIYDRYGTRGAASGGDGRIEQVVTVTDETTFKLAGWFYNPVAGDPDDATLTLEFRDVSQVVLGTHTLSGNTETPEYLIYKETTGSIPANTVDARVEIFYNKGSGGTVNNASIDEVLLDLNPPGVTAWDDGLNAKTMWRLPLDTLRDRAPVPQTWSLAGSAALTASSPYASGNSIRLPGTDSSVVLPTISPRIDQGAGTSASLMFWLYLDTLAASQGILMFGDPSTDDDRLQLHINSGSELTLFARVATSTRLDERVAVGSVFTAATWHFCELQLLNQCAALYVDGTPVLSNFIEGSTGWEFVQQLRIGSARLGGGLTYMVGNVADIWLTGPDFAYRRESYTNPTVQMPLPGALITSDPADLQASDGEPAIFMVEATGTGVVSYQWEDEQGEIIGAVTNTLLTTADENTPAYRVRAKVTDDNGSVYTTWATLSVVGAAIGAVPRSALLWNFEDDNFTWFDASHDTFDATSGYSATAYLDGLKQRGFDGIWILNDTNTTAVDSSGNSYNGSYSGGYLQGQVSFIDDGLRSTQFDTNGFMWITGAGPGGTGMIATLAFSAAAILSMDSDLDRVLVHKWGSTTPDAGLALYVSATNLRVEIRDDTDTLQLTYNIAGTYSSGDIIIIDLNSMSAAGVYAFDVYQNFTLIGSDSGDLAGAYTLAADAYLEFGFTGSRTMQYLAYKSGGLVAGDISALSMAYDANFVGYNPSLGARELQDVVCMKYQFDPGWAVLWSDWEIGGDKWNTLDEDWDDLYSGGEEENMYWLTENALLLSDQTIVKDGLKQYFVNRVQIDLSEHVEQWRTNRWIYANQFYFHMDTENENDSIVQAKIGWSDTMMDTPDYTANTQLNIQQRNNSGDVKWDFRSTGRYLAVEFNFNGADKVRFTGGELNAKQGHGR